MSSRSGSRVGSTRICEFYQQGRCKYGDTCRNEHPGAGRSNSNVNRFSSLSGQDANRARSTDKGNNAQNLPYHLNKEVMILDLKDERPQWPLSAYAPGKDAPRQLFGGFPIEQSFEEMRIMFYLAQANGNTQPAIQAEEQYLQQINGQIEKILQDPDGAIQYILDGEKEHPNRRELVNAVNSSHNGITLSDPFNQSRTNSSTFGQPSVMNPLQQASNLLQVPNALNTQNRFSSFGAPSPLSQPLNNSNTAFGSASRLASNATFGQASQLGSASISGQSGQSISTSPFGQATRLASTSGFGQPSSLGANSPFTTNSTANPFSNQQSQANFSLSSASPFAVSNNNDINNRTNDQPTSTFGQPGFGQQSTNPVSSFSGSNPNVNQISPFAQNTQSNSNNAIQSLHTSFDQNRQSQSISPFQANNDNNMMTPLSHAHPSALSQTNESTATPALSDYAGHRNGQLQTWKGRSVTNIEGNNYYHKTGNNTGSSKDLERIWFPDGPPVNNSYAIESGEAYAKYGADLEQQYRTCAQHGRFTDGIPILAPQRAWTRFDL